IFAAGDRLLLDVEREQVPMLLGKLNRLKLRARVTLAKQPQLAVVAGSASSPELPDDAVIAPDPRLAEAGWRAIVAAPEATEAGATDRDEADWDRHRLALGLPDGSRDLEAEKTLLLEAGFDELHGISWTKGCYMGQELTARTRYRGLIKRRLVPVAIDGRLPAPGTPITMQGAEVGTMRSGRDNAGLATLRLEALAAGAGLRAGDAVLTARPPAWMALPQAQAAT
ncbi:MAG: folate-binding protein YgfZ, partial [Acidisphaera sp.]|nr:folate-binding protein YgfZ [Acidisphaera sp.]